MKILFLILSWFFSMSVFSCGTDTIANVNQCRVDDLIEKFVDYQSCHWNKDDEHTYANLICDPLISLGYFQEKLSNWKLSEISRITEEIRINSIKLSLQNIGVKFGEYGRVDGLRRLMDKCGHYDANPSIWIKEVFKVGNESILSCLQSKKIEIEKEESLELSRKQAKDLINQQIKNYDCNLITEEYLKLLCQSKE